jgi:hypothetical protein
MTKVMVAIQHTQMQPWESILNFNRSEGWLSDSMPNEVQIVIFSGKSNSRVVNSLDRLHEKTRWGPFGRLLVPIDCFLTLPLKHFIPCFFQSKAFQPYIHLEIDIPDVVTFFFWKYLAVYRYFLDYTDADYLFTTNSSNYIQPKLLSNLVQSAPNSGFYAGSSLNAGRHQFISGANRIFSRDVVSLVVENRALINRHLLEDVAQGSLLRSLNVDLVPLQTLNVHSVSEVLKLDSLQLSRCHQIRVKSGSLREIQDVEILKAIRSRLILGT